MIKTHRGIWLTSLLVAVLLASGLWFKQSQTSAQQRAGGPSQVIWQSMKHAGAPAGNALYRTPVPGGWLVLIHHEEERQHSTSLGVGRGMGIGSGLTFVPDPDHKWK